MATETSTGEPLPVGRAGDRGMVGVVLAAGLGTRLRPLTVLRPKPLCPVGNIALVDQAIDRIRAVTDAIAVNVHAGRTRMERHFEAGGPVADAIVPMADGEGRGGARRSVAVHLSFEEPDVLGTAGALGQLRWWIDGRAALVVNGDTWTTSDLTSFVDGWDGERVAVLLHEPGPAAVRAGSAFGPRSRLVATIVPWHELSKLTARPSGLYGCCLAPAAQEQRLAVSACGGPFFDCGTPASYLAANVAAAALEGRGSLLAPGASVTGVVSHAVVGDAVVEGSVERSVVWSGGRVGPTERLVDAIRTDVGTTVLVRS